MHTVANMVPVIVVRKGNPKKIEGLRDFVRPDVRIGVTDARYTTSGQIVQQALRNAGIREQVMARHPVENRSSGYMVNQVQIDALDAATAWDAVAVGVPDELDIVPIEPAFMPSTFTDSDGMTYRDGNVAVGLVELKTSTRPEATRRFVRFILSAEGQAIWKASGFAPARPSGAPATAPASTQP